MSIVYTFIFFYSIYIHLIMSDTCREVKLTSLVFESINTNEIMHLNAGSVHHGKHYSMCTPPLPPRPRPRPLLSPRRHSLEP